MGWARGLGSCGEHIGVYNASAILLKVLGLWFRVGVQLPLLSGALGRFRVYVSPIPQLKAFGTHDPKSKLLKGGSIGDYTGEYYGGY